MSYKIKVNSTLGIIEVKHKGMLDIDEIRAAREDAGKSLADNEFRKVSVDLLDATPNQTMMELFGFSASYHDLFPRNVKIAIVYSPDSTDREDVLFSETVARNRNALLRIFTDKKEALDWLESKK